MTDPAATICLTFDVDTDAGWRTTPEVPASAPLTKFSWGRFSVRRGVPRILGLLEELEVPATFFVPGGTAERYPDAVRSIAENGHEIGHHGHDHHMPSTVGAEIQKLEIERGYEAIEGCVGIAPLGYRSPGWEVTPETFQLVVERGFIYDSSFMGDDRPYVEHHDGRDLLVIPVDWGLDDFIHFGCLREFQGSLNDPAAVFGLWQTAVESAIDDRRPVTLTMHPEVIGRAWVFGAFAAFIRRLAEDPRISFSTCAEVAKNHRALTEQPG